MKTQDIKTQRKGLKRKKDNSAKVPFFPFYTTERFPRGDRNERNRRTIFSVRRRQRSRFEKSIGSASVSIWCVFKPAVSYFPYVVSFPIFSFCFPFLILLLLLLPYRFISCFCFLSFIWGLTFSHMTVSASDICTAAAGSSARLCRYCFGRFQETLKRWILSVRSCFSCFSIFCIITHSVQTKLSASYLYSFFCLFAFFCPFLLFLLF